MPDPTKPSRSSSSGRWIAGATLVTAAVAGSDAWASAGHSDPVAPALLLLVIILVAAKLAGDLAARVGQPAVLGELAVGVLLGNLSGIGVTLFEPIKTSPAIELLAGLGVLLLLFEVGLESTVGDMMKVGASSLLVAVIGVVTPMALGFGVGRVFLPQAGPYVWAFLGATLCATSVGITARVLQDMNRSQTPEARIILGAAVIDDVLGLVILAVVTGVITATDAGGTLSAGSIGLIVLKAAGFLVGALVLGSMLAPRLFNLASRLNARGVLLAVGLAFCFLLSWLASLVGLAPIVGAFAAGLVLEELHYRDFRKKGEHSLAQLIEPISSFLSPIFFVLMGMNTDLSAFARREVVLFAAVLTLAAILGKQLCGLGVLGKGYDRLSVGIGMIPRGEVGLIFANIGMGLSIAGSRIIDAAEYSALVVMVIVTTLVTPPALQWSMNRRRP